MRDFTEYYTAGVAQSVLRVSYTKLKTYVKNRKIRTWQPPGKQHVVYHKGDVDALAEELHASEARIRIIDKEESVDDDDYPSRASLDGSRGSFVSTSRRNYGEAMD